MELAFGTGIEAMTRRDHTTTIRIGNSTRADIDSIREDMERMLDEYAARESLAVNRSKLGIDEVIRTLIEYWKAGRFEDKNSVASETVPVSDNA